MCCRMAGESTLHMTTMNMFKYAGRFNLVVEQLFNPFKLEINECQPTENT